MNSIEANNGYLISAVSNSDVKHAAAAAYSIKIENPQAEIALAIPAALEIPNKYTIPFDYISEFPYESSEDRRANDWQLYWTTPFTYTICVDAYSLVKENHDNTWDYLIDHYNLYFNNSAYNFKNEMISNSLHRKIYEENELIDIRSDIFYFKKDNEEALSYFKLLDPLMRNWRELINNLIPPKFHSGDYDSDLIHSICLCRTYQYENALSINTSLFNLIDMRDSESRFHKARKGWLNYLNVWSTVGANIKIQNHIVSGILSYNHPEFLTDEIYEHHVEEYRYRTK
jgi:hypothetical protein